MISHVVLRPIEPGDLDAIFEQMRDPESVSMAACTADDPNDRGAFDVHLAQVLTSGATTRAIVCDERFAGTVASFSSEGTTEVTYWIDRAYWGTVSQRARSAYQICAKPPSTATSLPVMKLLSSDARNVAAAAISAGSAMRRSGVMDA